MGGTPARWRTLSNDARKEPEWAEVYAMMDVVQPWNVGRYETLAAADSWKDIVVIPDVKRAAANGQLYMPVVFPGFSWQMSWCRACGTHLGWIYRCAGDSFHGLLLAQLVRR